MSGIEKELDMLKTQTAALDTYVGELQELEQWNMPIEWRERALRIRSESAPMFFKLVAGLILDALIQGLANILDGRKTSGKDNLTLEYVIENYPDPSIRASCREKLSEIRSGATYADIKKARNRILSHSDYTTMIRYDTMTPKDFPNLRLESLRSLVREIIEMISKMTRQSAVDLLPKEWQGVSVLFNLLEQK
jgi:hypothetical protein